MLLTALLLHLFLLLDEFPTILDLSNGGLAEVSQLLDLRAGFLGSGQLRHEADVLPEEVLHLLVGKLVFSIPFATEAGSSLLLPPIGWIVMGELGQLVPFGASVLIVGLDGMLWWLGASATPLVAPFLFIVGRHDHESK